MEITNQYIQDYLIFKIVEDLVNSNSVENDILSYCYNYSFIDRAREIIPQKIKKDIILNKITSSSLSINESNILFNIIQAYELSSVELNSIKTKLLNSVSGLFSYFSFDEELEEQDFLIGFKFVESNWEDFQIEELKYENPKNIKFEKTNQTLINRINNGHLNKKWLYLFSNKAFKEKYYQEFINNSTIQEIINLYNNYPVFYEALKQKFLK